jgi:putative spermidine/putrescine transport system permease protein
VTRSTSRAATLLALPVLATALLFLIPLAIMAAESFVLRGRDGSITLSIDQYARFFSDSYYAGSLGLTFATAALVAGVAIALAYPVALLYWRAGRQARSIMLALLLAPFYANIVVAVFGWIVLLAPGGAVNALLLKAGAIAAPIDFLNGYAAIVFISVHRCLPFVVLLLANALANIDDDVLQCASVCGASGPRVFWTVVFPLSMPGVVAGAIVAFSLTAAGFVIPRLVGGAAGSRFAAVLMYQQITATQNWRFGAAIGVLLLAVSVLTVAGGMRFARRLRAGRVLSDAFIQ